MKIRLFGVLICLVVGIAANSGLSQTQESFNKLEERVQRLEAEKTLLEKRLELKEMALDTALSQKVRDLDLQVGTMRQQVREDSLLVKVFTVALAVVGFGIIISAWLGAKALVDRKASEMIEEVFDKRKDEFLGLLERQNVEKQLRLYKKILVLTPEGHSKVFLEDFFRNEDFYPPYFESFSLADKVDYSKFDVIIFNNDDGLGFSKERREIVETIDKIPRNKMCFYFGGQPNVILQDTTTFASANFRSQLYGNLVNALRYHDLLIKSGQS